MRRIDQLDEQIMAALNKKGAITPNSTFIAKQLDKPTATIANRIKRLERMGVVGGYKPAVEHKKLGEELEAFFLMQVPAGEDIEKYAQKICESFPEIKDLALVSGEWCFIGKIRAKDMDGYTKIISNIYRDAKPLKFVDMISPKTYKEEH